MNKCQSQWKNEKSDDYDILNQTTLTYLETVIPKIVKHQKELIVDFMGDCKQSVYSCMSSVAVNGVSPRPTQSVISFLNPRISACSTVINSCETLLNISTKELLADWITQNICGEYDFDNDVCSLIALKEKIVGMMEICGLMVCVKTVPRIIQNWQALMKNYPVIVGLVFLLMIGPGLVISGMIVLIGLLNLESC